jgi:ankyrin repeat protein
MYYKEKKRVEPVSIKLAKRFLISIFALLFASSLSCSIPATAGHTSDQEKPTPGMTDPVLINAVRDKNLTLVRELLSQGRNANTTDDQGYAILTLAVFMDSPPIMEVLFEFNADPNLAEESAPTPLEVAVMRRNDKAITLLLQHGARVDITPTIGPLLSQAISFESLRTVEQLLISGADPNAQNKTGATPLSYAVSHDKKFVLLLLAHGANPNIYDQAGWSPLLIAVKSNDVEKVRLLIEHGADVNHGDRDGWTAYDQALLQGCPAIVAELEKVGATQ